MNIAVHFIRTRINLILALNMDQDTETIRKLLSTFKKNIHGSLKNINNLTLKNYDIL